MIDDDIPFEDARSPSSQREQGEAQPAPLMNAKQASDGAADAIEAELDELQARFAANEQAEQEAREQWRQKQRLEIQEKFRRGELPTHFKQCRTCGRAILTLNFKEACKYGKTYSNLIF